LYPIWDKCNGRRHNFKSPTITATTNNKIFTLWGLGWFPWAIKLRQWLTSKNWTCYTYPKSTIFASTALLNSQLLTAFARLKIKFVSYSWRCKLFAKCSNIHSYVDPHMAVENQSFKTFWDAGVEGMGRNEGESGWVFQVLDWDTMGVDFCKNDNYERTKTKWYWKTEDVDGWRLEVGQRFGQGSKQWTSRVEDGIGLTLVWAQSIHESVLVASRNMGLEWKMLAQFRGKEVSCVQWEPGNSGSRRDFLPSNRV